MTSTTTSRQSLSSNSPEGHDGALHELLHAWTTNDDLRRCGADLPARFEARHRLDSARLNAAQIRSTGRQFVNA